MEKDKWIYFFAANALPITMIFGYLFNMPYLFLSIFFIVLGLFSFLDIFVKRDESYTYDSVITLPENDGRLAPWLYEIASATHLLAHAVALGLGIYYVQFKEPFWAWFLYAIPMGFSGASLLGLCHEYMHKNNALEKVLSRFFASLEFWSVHEYEHLFYHHHLDHICTPYDRSHAKLNQSFYSYIFHGFVNNYKSAWIKQHEISAEQKISFYNILKNPFLKWVSFSFLLTISILVFVGFNAFLFFVVQVLIANLVFLGITYNQHYGLTRRMKADGKFEDFTFMNTWCSDHFITSRQLFNLSHHGHHHLFQLCRYPHLKIIRLGPLLPYGYTTMFLISFIPKLWFKIMNPRVEEVFRLRDQYEKEGKL